MKVGLALGSGSARGWSHIGIINELKDNGIIPDVVCGSSIGALVSASYVAGNLDKLETWVCSLKKLDVVRFFELNTSFSGFINKDRLHYFLKQFVADENVLIENLSRRFGAVATDLETGREVWLTKGSILKAVWSSMSLPGLFPAIKYNNDWLIDGGVVNPVPVSLCRALGADMIIAVNLNGNIVGKHLKNRKKNLKKENGIVTKITDLVASYTSPIFSRTKVEEQPPGLFESIASSINIMQDRITKSRMSGDPPEILICPKLAHIALLEFYRAEEAIEKGREAVKKMLPEIKQILEG